MYGSSMKATSSDVIFTKFSKCMRSAGLRIEALNKYVALSQQGDETIDARKRFSSSSGTNWRQEWRICK